MTAALSELIARRDALERQIREAQTASKQAAINQVRTLMAEHGLTAAALIAKGPAKAGVKTGTKVAAKYRDTVSGQTWTGRGLKPKWLSAALVNGKALDDFRI